MKEPEFDKDRKSFMAWLGRNYSDLLESDRGRLLDYGAMVLQRSEGLGLISRADRPRFHMRHLREVAAPVFVKLPEREARVVDIGSGAGLPGIPLAILRPDVSVVLVEPRHRRAAFLERAVLQLGLKRVEVVTASLDAFVRGNREITFDLAVSRALSWSQVMVTPLKAIVAPHGRLVRFGDPSFKLPGVQVLRIESESPRAIQVWPPATWEDLPRAE
jgi:16S rRNA (guanine(527)-N(7))-methyltransferase RsmG